MYEDIKTFCDEIMDEALEGLCLCVGIRTCLPVARGQSGTMLYGTLTQPKQTNTLRPPGPGYEHYKRPNVERGLLVGVSYHLLTQPIGIERMYSKTCLKRNLKGPEHFSAKARFPFNQGTLHTV